MKTTWVNTWARNTELGDERLFMLPYGSKRTHPKGWSPGTTKLKNGEIWWWESENLPEKRVARAEGKREIESQLDESEREG